MAILRSKKTSKTHFLYQKTKPTNLKTGNPETGSNEPNSNFIKIKTLNFQNPRSATKPMF
ncbi:hypothetical protein OIU85_009146 [Salix viminalis]|uniref:Uncharacterized protein n=1 Tax=Salix viminalis TaxID=40686 RepID=A0A9Q0NZ39_SALVM|nr:hypothetical protein OIU85_009146 [Salix viminalis]